MSSHSVIARNPSSYCASRLPASASGRRTAIADSKSPRAAAAFASLIESLVTVPRFAVGAVPFNHTAGSNESNSEREKTLGTTRRQPIRANGWLRPPCVTVHTRASRPLGSDAAAAVCWDVETMAMWDRYDVRDEQRDRGEAWDHNFGSRGGVSERDRDHER